MKCAVGNGVESVSDLPIFLMLYVKLFYLVIDIKAATGVRAVNVHRADAAWCDQLGVDNALQCCLGCMKFTAVTVQNRPNACWTRYLSI